MRLSKLLILFLIVSALFGEGMKEKIEYIQFKTITLQKFFNYLSSRYKVNIVFEEPQLRAYVTPLLDCKTLP